MDSYIHKSQQTPSRTNTKKIIPRHQTTEIQSLKNRQGVGYEGIHYICGNNQEELQQTFNQKSSGG